jgi:hypothetical protein
MFFFLVSKSIGGLSRKKFEHLLWRTIYFKLSLVCSNKNSFEINKNNLLKLFYLGYMVKII